MTTAPRAGRVYRTELIRADIARLVDVDLGHAPAGDPVCWALWIDAATVACTDEPMTDDHAQHWARRMPGEHVTFQPGHRDGGYWVATPTHSLDPATPLVAPRGCSTPATAHPRPGGPSAKNAHRAGTPNHCQSTQEVTIMDQPTATGRVPMPHDTAQERYALTDAGHVVHAPVGDPPPPVLVLSCTACEHAYEASLHDVATGRLGCPNCGGWTFLAELTVPPAAGGVR